MWYITTYRPRILGKADMKRYKNILEPLFKQSRIGLFFDFDGTLSPIVPRPEDAKITPENQEYLQQLQKKVNVIAIISGRSATDVAKKVNLPGAEYVGNHGLEYIKSGKLTVLSVVEPYLPAIRAAADALQPKLLPNMQLENKTVTLSIHYRQTKKPTEARKIFFPIAQRVAEQTGLSLFEGRMIFELRPPIKLDKGTAFSTLVKENKLDGALFVGDDITDTAAFKAATQLRETKICQAFSIGVMDEETPQEVVDSSDSSVEGAAGVSALLGWLNEKLIASST